MSNNSTARAILSNGRSSIVNNTLRFQALDALGGPLYTHHVEGSSISAFSLD